MSRRWQRGTASTRPIQKFPDKSNPINKRGYSKPGRDREVKKCTFQAAAFKRNPKRNKK